MSGCRDDGATLMLQFAMVGGGGSRSFVMLTELYPDGAAVARERVGLGLANGVTFHSVLSARCTATS